MARAAEKSSTESERSADRPAASAGKSEASGKAETASSKSDPVAGAAEPQSEGKDAKGGAGIEAARAEGAASGEQTAGADGQTASSAAPSTQDGAQPTSPSSYVEWMKRQHQALQDILDKRSGGSGEPFAIAREFAASWLPHAIVERDVLRAIGRGGEAGEAIAEAEVRKDLVNLLLANLLDRGPRGAEKAALDALAEQFSALVQQGRREEGGLLAAVETVVASGRLPMQEIERRTERARQQFAELDDDESIGEAIEALAPRRLSVHEERQHSEREQSMPRYSSQGRDRDEQGRFLPEDERGYGRSGEGRGTPNRDEAGRFVSDADRRMRGRYDEDEGRGRRMSQRDSDEDERYGSRDRGQGGWFGDREGHSEASRRGWENSDHGRSGWYGDREGHSEASRRGWENSDHGRSGWYGDSEGHSEAARRGWDEGHRSQRRDDDEGGRYRERSDERRGGYESRGGRYEERGGGYESRSGSEGRGGGYESRGGGSQGRGGYESRGGGRDEDDDRGSRGGHGGWSGDPEGHSEASRRGWENRRR